MVEGISLLPAGYLIKNHKSPFPEILSLSRGELRTKGMDDSKDTLPYSVHFLARMEAFHRREKKGRTPVQDNSQNCRSPTQAKHRGSESLNTNHNDPRDWFYYSPADYSRDQTRN